MPYVGQIKTFAYNESPGPEWLLCDGSTLQISSSIGIRALFLIIGTQYGGNGTTTFTLPDLRVINPRSSNRLNLGNGTIFRGQLYLKYYICIDGDYPQFIEHLVPTCPCVIRTISSGNGPFYMAFDSYHSYMYVSNGLSNTVSVFDTNNYSLITTITVGNEPYGIALDNNGQLYVNNHLDDNISVINTSSNTVITTISTNSYPHGLCFDSFNNRMYVCAYLASTLTNTVVTTISLPSSATGCDYVSSNDRVYCTLAAINKVVSIDTTTNLIVSTIDVGDTPQYMSFDFNSNILYVSNPISNNISVIDVNTDTVIKTIPVEEFPRDIEYDSTNDRIWVANYDTDNISILCT